MTRARKAAKGLVTPPPLHRWMEAALLLCVSLVQGAASTLKMIFKRKGRDWHTDDAREVLPHATSSTPIKETHQAATTGLTTGNGPSAVFPAKAVIQTPRNARTSDPSALRALTGPPPSRGTWVKKPMAMSLSFRAKARSAADPEPKGHAQALSALMPTNVGIQGRAQTLSRLAASIQRTRENRSWIPTLILSLSNDAGISDVLCEMLRATSA